MLLSKSQIIEISRPAHKRIKIWIYIKTNIMIDIKTNISVAETEPEREPVASLKGPCH